MRTWSTLLGSLVLLGMGVTHHRSVHDAPTPHTGGIHHALFLAGGRIVTGLLRAGVRVGPMILLTIRGRKSGQPHTTLVDLFERNGQRYLVSTHGGDASGWVLNLRAAGEGVLTRGRHSQPFTAIELTPEAAGLALREAVGPRLASPVGGFVLRRTLAVGPNPTLDDFIGVARLHPVFQLTPAPRPRKENHLMTRHTRLRTANADERLPASHPQFPRKESQL